MADSSKDAAKGATVSDAAKEHASSVPSVPEQLEALLATLRGKPIISDILRQLHEGLPRDLYYHSASHTDDVLREAVLFALLDGLGEREIELLAVAAAYHDAGFMSSPVNNEAIGARMARAAMEKSGNFTETEIDTVEKMILDTRLVSTEHGLMQIPTLNLSKYLLDADLSNFGRDDFFEMGEKLRRELGYDRGLFLRRTLELLVNHSWKVEPARNLREVQKQANLRKLQELVQRVNRSDQQAMSLTQGLERLAFLAKLPLLLNSSLDTRQVVGAALDQVKLRLQSEAATVFLLNDASTELSFWVLKGSETQKLSNLKMPSGKGIVGWVIERQEGVLSNDVQNDARFFKTIDKDSGFKTRNMLCVPLVVRGATCLGAIQVINREFGAEFQTDDLLFLEQFASQVAMAIDNAKLHETLRERTRQIEALDKRKNEMITILAHEFRTPLNVIQTSADIMTSGLLNDEAALQKIQNTLKNGVERLTRLVSQVRNLSLVSNGELKVKHEAVPVPNFFEAIMKEFSAAATSRKIELLMSVGANVTSVVGDFALLFIAFKNLVSNAIRFTPNGGKVEVIAELHAALVEFRIVDTGVGLAQTEFGLIFEKFYEVGDVMHHASGEFEFKSRGLGLGLATVRSILASHGASIEVQSKIGEGTTFKFRLPVPE